jgi:hypothetical protein
MDTPTAVLPGTPTTSRGELKDWLLANKLPGYLELTQDTFQSVMNAPHAPLVVIVPSNEKMEEKIEEKVKAMAGVWKEKTGGTGLVGGGKGKGPGREVIWAWMDGERWGDWMKSMYGLGIGEGDRDLASVKVVIASHKVRLRLSLPPLGLFPPFPMSEDSSLSPTRLTGARLLRPRPRRHTVYAFQPLCALYFAVSDCEWQAWL